MKIAKKHFYQVLEELFNYLYDQEYVQYINDKLDHKYFKINKDFYQCEITRNYLKTKDEEMLLSDEVITKTKKKNGFYTVEEKDYKDEYFVINEEKNDIENLLIPYVIKYPFLANIPPVINLLGKDQDFFTFKKEEIEVLKEALKEYKENDDYNKNLFTKRINSLW